MYSFGDNLRSVTNIPGDSFWNRHDKTKTLLNSLILASNMRTECEVFGGFRDLIPVDALKQRGKRSWSETCAMRKRGVERTGERLSMINIGYQVPWYSRWPSGYSCKKAEKLWPAARVGHGVIPGGQQGHPLLAAHLG